MAKPGQSQLARLRVESIKLELNKRITIFSLHLEGVEVLHGGKINLKARHASGKSLTGQERVIVQQIVRKMVVKNAQKIANLDLKNVIGIHGECVWVPKVKPQR
jgi:hypothetical protein